MGISPIFPLKNINHLFLKSYGSPLKKNENFNLLTNDYDINRNSSLYFGDTNSDLKFAQDNKIMFISIGKELKKINKDSNFISLLNFEEIEY